MRFVLATAVACLFVSGVASAADADAARRLTNIPAQELGAALQALAKERGFQVVYVEKEVAGLRTAGVQGELTPEEALAKLLQGTGMTFQNIGASGVSIVPIASSPAVPRVHNSENGAYVHLSQAVQPSPSEGEGQGEDKTKKAEAEEDDHPVRGIPEILVRGKKGQFSLNADIERTEDDIQPYVVIDRAKIEQSGASNVEDLLKNQLTMNYVSFSSSQVAPSIGSANESAVNLRGLGLGQTLILIDGRRAGLRGAFGQEGQADINGIPLSAIERIEVLPATASGIYGGSATGGVVNVVLRRDYSGVETTLTYENSTRNDGSGRRVDLSAGLNLSSRTSLFLLGSYQEKGSLVAADRNFYVHDYVQRTDANRRAYDPARYLNGFPPLGATTNISSVAVFNSAIGRSVAPNLTLKSTGASLGSPITFVPYKYAGILGDQGAALLENAGLYNLEPAATDQVSGRYASLVNEPTIQYFQSTIRHEISPLLDAFADFSLSKNNSEFVSNAINAQFIIPSSSEVNPFRQNIRVSVPIYIQEGSVADTDSTSTRGIFGLKAKLPHGWSSEIDYTFDRSDLRQTLRSTRLSTAATTAVTNGTMPVLSDDGIPFDFSGYVIPGNIAAPSHSIQQTGTLRAGGPVGMLKSGPVGLSALLEYRNQDFGQFTQIVHDANNQQSELAFSPQSSAVISAYLEAHVPMISDKMALPFVRRAELQLAGRYESYHNVGGFVIQGSYDEASRPRNDISSIDPTVGLQIEFKNDLTLRASYGEGFHPPRLSQLNPLPAAPGSSSSVRDPKRGNQPIGIITVQRGGNPDLRPERSTGWSAGFIYRPAFLEEIRISADWSRVTKRDNITSLSLSQSAIDDEDNLPGVVVRNTDPTTFGSFDVGPIVLFNGALFNATRAEIESVDISLAYSRTAGRVGRFEFSAAGTRLLKNLLQSVATQDPRERVGTVLSPDWQANANLQWSLGAITAVWSTRYLDAGWVREDHAFSAFQGSARVPSATYHDLVGMYDFGTESSAFGGVLANARLRFGIKNIFDTPPRFLGEFGGNYDPAISPMLATYFISVTKAF